MFLSYTTPTTYTAAAITPRTGRSRQGEPMKCFECAIRSFEHFQLRRLESLVSEKHECSGFFSRPLQALT